jgi:hypothetical protein
MLNQIKKDHRIFMTGSNHNIQLHGFSYASMKAYGAVVYIRSVDVAGCVHVKLLCSQSRVAPQPNKKRKKAITLPKLELCSAALLSKLLNKVVSQLDIDFESINMWSDSTVVLSWIKKDPSNFTRYVANRVSVIHEFTSKYTWRHICTEDNPADKISKGLMPTQLINNQMWWHGPKFLTINQH